jgi:glucosylceramidase
MKKIVSLFALLALVACQDDSNTMKGVKAYQTSASGDKLTSLETSDEAADATITLKPETTFQEITGFGGAFTESSAYLLNQISQKNRDKILNAYFSEEGANYSLTRTHMSSCDFSLNSYSYAPVADDLNLENFSIEEDREDIIPMIKDAQAISKNGFRIIASPWTAPPWMKDNNDWFGGSLLKEHYPTWALFFSKYYLAYEKEGIDIWAFTVENEPLGNDSHWESMHYTPEEMGSFVKENLVSQFMEEGVEAKILVYDQNKGEEMLPWARALLNDDTLKSNIYGTAVHWYFGTQDWFPESLQETHELAPDKHIIHTEACIDSEVPHWNDDAWYWKNEATDWGFQWAPEKDKHLHPKYVPTYRYAKDIIGCLNNWVEGWVDWNMVLDEKGGPNHANNWCIAPVLVDVAKDEVYFTPLYYVMNHFSKFIRPGAKRIDFSCSDETLMVTAAQNLDGSTSVVVLNMEDEPKTIEFKLNEEKVHFTISPRALQTIFIP